MSPDPSPRPLVQLPVAGGAPAEPAPRHETILPDEPAGVLHELHDALASTGAARHTALLSVAARHPALLEVWARLSEQTLESGDAATAYAYARVAYHRGLDRLRRHGWGGTGIVRWSQPSNRGFLRGLRALLAAAAAIGEDEESTRCREFLLDLDPDDGLGAARYPETPGPGWTPPPIP